jgi:hypothetical protein
MGNYTVNQFCTHERNLPVLLRLAGIILIQRRIKSDRKGKFYGEKQETKHGTALVLEHFRSRNDAELGPDEGL